MFLYGRAPHDPLGFRFLHYCWLHSTQALDGGHLRSSPSSACVYSLKWFLQECLKGQNRDRDLPGTTQSYCYCKECSLVPGIDTDGLQLPAFERKNTSAERASREQSQHWVKGHYWGAVPAWWLSSGPSPAQQMPTYLRNKNQR